MREVTPEHMKKVLHICLGYNYSTFDLVWHCWGWEWVLCEWSGEFQRAWPLEGGVASVAAGIEQCTTF